MAGSDEMSNILSQLLRGSSASSSSLKAANNYMHLLHSSAPPNPSHELFGRSSDSGGYFDARRISSENDVSCDSVKEPVASDVPLSSAPPRNSSKRIRSRAAEVHNMTEKRRRNKINEKMKALQNLIPNSNKTDKASMLDEAIEYLKQLQLQVQMLMMRNGLSLHPMCFPGVMQHAQLPHMGLGFEEGSNKVPKSSRASAFYGNEENSMQSTYDISIGCTNLNQPMIIPSAANVPTWEASFAFEPSAQAYYRPFFDTTSSKELLFSDGVQPSDSNRTVINSSSDTDKVSSKSSKSPDV